ncbi:hypothetical protein ACF1DV_37605 [Streptomyces achromogenes]|uniref:hypothetical protein n=1 Tax=Streptomyces achromogenes TaxID=67255 RepID=UPI0036F9637D
MSTPRRPLGTGPSTTRSTTTTDPTDPSPRLLPVERAELDEQLTDDEQWTPHDWTGRRPLGPGPIAEL